MNQELRNQLLSLLKYSGARSRERILDDLQALEWPFEQAWPHFRHPNGAWIFYEDIEAGANHESYPMTLVGKDAAWAIQAINQGIDSRLEACFLPGTGSRNDNPGRHDACESRTMKIAVLNGMEVHGILADQDLTRLELNLSPQSLAVFCRRLAEMEATDQDRDGGEAPEHLLESILETLGFDDSGKLNPKEDRHEG